MPTALTEGVRVTVESTYLEEHSSPEENRFAFAFFVTIATRAHRGSASPAALENSNGKVEEVEGPGVVGEQPVLDPGDAHRYTGGTVVVAPVGTMEGTYEMHDGKGAVLRGQHPALQPAHAGRGSVPRPPVTVPGAHSDASRYSRKLSQSQVMPSCSAARLVLDVLEHALDIRRCPCTRRRGIEVSLLVG